VTGKKMDVLEFKDRLTMLGIQPLGNDDTANLMAGNITTSSLMGEQKRVPSVFESLKTQLPEPTIVPENTLKDLGLSSHIYNTNPTGPS